MSSFPRLSAKQLVSRAFEGIQPLVPKGITSLGFILYSYHRLPVSARFWYALLKDGQFHMPSRRQIPLFKVFMAPSVAEDVVTTLYSGYVGQGPRVAGFEAALRSFLGYPHLVTANSGTSALHLAFHMIRTARLISPSINESSTFPAIQPGDEALVTPLTCVATNWPLLANHFRLKWVDVSDDDFNIDPEDIQRKLSPRTKVIVIVHWGGYPADLDRISGILQSFEQEYGFRPVIVEDCAHALGSEYRGKRVGAMGTFAAFSFQAVKYLTTCDGGMLVLPTSELHQRAKLLRWYGLDRSSTASRTFHEEDANEWGYKFHMNDVSATIGLCNLRHLDNLLTAARQNAIFYNQSLRHCDGVILPLYRPDRLSSYYLYSVRVRRRADFQRWMFEQGIETGQVHRRNDTHPCVSDFRVSLPTLDAIHREIVCLPVGWWITDEEREHIVSSIRRGW